MVKIIDNRTETLLADLKTEITPESKLSIAAACFSIYAYEALKTELNQIKELRFLFNSPTFVSERTEKEKREFYIPRQNRERSLYNAEFEVRLRNELTQRAVARECAEWIRQKVSFRSNASSGRIQPVLAVDKVAYLQVEGFTTVDLGCERGDAVNYNVIKLDPASSIKFIQDFDEIWRDQSRLQDVTEEVVDNIAAVYRENSPEFIYFVALYNIFREFLENISEDDLPNEDVGFKNSQIWKLLYSFQKDAALAIINKLEKYNGCVLADSVGLGKTFTALGVVKYYENRNKNVLVLCPKKLANNWNTFKANYKNNPIVGDRLRYDVLFHTDLSRDHGYSNGFDLQQLNWSAYDLVVIDESHNFRNGGSSAGRRDERRENRYERLMNRIIRQGVKTKVLMLSATPVNNRFFDLRNQLSLAYEGDVSIIDEKLKLGRSLDQIFISAQKAFNEWSRFDVKERTTANLLKMLNFDFFEVLDAVTIARSRKHIERYYDTTEIGAFPTRLKPISLTPALTDIPGAIAYADIYAELMKLSLSIYTPSQFIQPSRKEKYANVLGAKYTGISVEGREEGLRRLMAINLMKRMESSVDSFRSTLQRITNHIARTIKTVDDFENKVVKNGGNVRVSDFSGLGSFEDDVEFDDDDRGSVDIYAVGEKYGIDLADMDYLRWKEELVSDRVILEKLLESVRVVGPDHDAKLLELIGLLARKFANPINEGNRKVLIFTAFADTAEYLYKHVAPVVKQKYGLNVAMITGSTEGKTTDPRIRREMNTILTYFSPLSKNKSALAPDDDREIDVLIATDCISEGQNLQDCDYLVNYDIHWNPVRIIQRFGRIDRIGSRNAQIQLVNFWPNVSLDEYIMLRSRVESRMKIVNLTATGDDNLLSDEEKVDLEYRKAQLKRLKEEVVDLEEMNGGVSITDLGLNEFRLDLIEYHKNHSSLEAAPLGLHSVTEAKKNMPPGVVYVLKNRSESINVDRKNRLHPFYMVYVDANGGVVCDHLSPKEILDRMRSLCKGRSQPLPELYREFNKETRDGRNMKKYSQLLSDAIASIVDLKQKSELDSLFSPGGTTALLSSISGLDDFELICFLVVR